MTPPRAIAEKADIESPRLAGVYAYWHGVAKGRLAPRRDEIDPRAIKTALSVVWLTRVIDGGADFEFRLAGEELKDFLGPSFSGKRLSECPKTPFFENMGRLFSHCVTTRAPLIVGPARTTYEPRNYSTQTVLILPLSDNGQDVTGLFGAVELK